MGRLARVHRGGGLGGACLPGPAGRPRRGSPRRQAGRAGHRCGGADHRGDRRGGSRGVGGGHRVGKGCTEETVCISGARGGMTANEFCHCLSESTGKAVRRSTRCFVPRVFRRDAFQPRGELEAHVSPRTKGRVPWSRAEACPWPRKTRKICQGQCASPPVSFG
jgi:hypothetical protein